MPSSSSISPLHRIERDAGRVRQIASVLVKYGFSDWLESVPFPELQGFLQRAGDSALQGPSREERIRLALTELGPTFIKIGQTLATRADLIGPELASELAKLQSNTPPDSPEDIIEIIEQQLGDQIDCFYAHFEKEAFASASIAQVHRAILHTGESVAVKVQHKGIQETIAADLSLLESVASLAEKHSESLRNYRPVQLVNEFRRSIERELDFTRERRNMETFEQNFELDETVHIPRTWEEFSSSKVLTMEFMQGVIGTRIGELRDAGLDLTEFTNRGADIFLKMIFRDSFYHADPHPGNLMYLPGGVVGILDFGMVGRVEDELRDDIESLVVAITQGDADSLTNTLWSLSPSQSSETREELKVDLSDLLADTKDAGDSLNISAVMTGVLDIFRKYQISPRRGLTGLLRTLVLLDGTARQLTSDFNLTNALIPYQDEAIRRRLSPRRLAKRFQRHILEWDRLLDDLPRDLSEFARKIKSGDFRVGLEHRHLDSVVNRLVLGIVASSTFLGSSLLWSLKAPPLIYDISLFGAAGYAVATFLAWELYRAIKKSQKDQP